MLSFEVSPVANLTYLDYRTIMLQVHRGPLKVYTKKVIQINRARGTVTEFSRKVRMGKLVTKK